MNDLVLGKMYVLRGPKHFSFFLFRDEEGNNVYGEVFRNQPFVLLAFNRSDGVSYSDFRTTGDYSLKVLTQDGKLGWMVVTEPFIKVIQPA